MRAGAPSWYTETTLVASSAAVSAIFAPIRAFTNVDFPALSRPTMTIRGGDHRMAPMRLAWPAKSGPSAARACRARSSPARTGSSGIPDAVIAPLQ